MSLVRTVTFVLFLASILYRIPKQIWHWGASRICTRLRHKIQIARLPPIMEPLLAQHQAKRFKLPECVAYRTLGNAARLCDCTVARKAHIAILDIPAPAKIAVDAERAGRKLKVEDVIGQEKSFELVLAFVGLL